MGLSGAVMNAVFDEVNVLPVLSNSMTTFVVLYSIIFSLNL